MEDEIAALSPALQHKMAQLALAGWAFTKRPFLNWITVLHPITSEIMLGYGASTLAQAVINCWARAHQEQNYDE